MQWTRGLSRTCRYVYVVVHEAGQRVSVFLLEFVFMTSGVAQHEHSECPSACVLPFSLQEWVPPDFKNYNDQGFKNPNM